MFRSLSSTPLPCHTISLAPRPSAMKSAVVLLVLGGVLAASWRHCATTHHRRLSSRHSGKPEPLQTWEGEGGPSPDGSDHAHHGAL